MNFSNYLTRPFFGQSKLILGALALAATSAFATTPFPFTPGAEPTDYFRLSSRSGRLEVQGDAGDPRLVYASQPDAAGNATLLAIFAPGGQFLRSAAEKITLEFRITGPGSFGVQWRAEQPQSSGYLFLLNQWPNQRGTARIFNTRMLPPSGQMEDDLLEKKELGRFSGTNWHRLELTSATVAEGVEIAVRLMEIEGNHEVANWKVVDRRYPLEVPGVMALRFFLNPEGEGDVGEPMIEVRQFAVEPELE